MSNLKTMDRELIKYKRLNLFFPLLSWLLFILLLIFNYAIYWYGNIPEETKFINTESPLFSTTYIFLLFINFIFFILLGISYNRNNNYPNIFIILLISNLLITMSLVAYFYYNIEIHLGNSIMALLIFSMFIISIFRLRKTIVSPKSK